MNEDGNGWFKQRYTEMCCNNENILIASNEFEYWSHLEGYHYVNSS